MSHEYLSGLEKMIREVKTGLLSSLLKKVCSWHSIEQPNTVFTYSGGITVAEIFSSGGLRGW